MGFREREMTGILALRREIMVNSCLTGRQRTLPSYRKRGGIFDFADAAAYNAALSTR
jgi:hypothetical protein